MEIFVVLVSFSATCEGVIEFYKKFWSLISEPLIQCTNECFEKGEMSCSQKQAVITLIEKKGKDRSFLENWRPISLVTVDAKIMSKAIATGTKMSCRTLSITIKLVL